MSAVPSTMRRRGRPTHLSGPNEEAYTQEQLDWLKAVDRYKRERNPRPDWPEVLAIAAELGYRKVGEPTVLPI